MLLPFSAFISGNFGLLFTLPREVQGFENLPYLKTQLSVQSHSCKNNEGGFHRNGTSAFQEMRSTLSAFVEFSSRPISPAVDGPIGLPSPVVMSQKAFPLREGAVPEAGRKEKGGVYRPKDASNFYY